MKNWARCVKIDEPHVVFEWDTNFILIDPIWHTLHKKQHTHFKIVIIVNLKKKIWITRIFVQWDWLDLFSKKNLITGLNYKLALQSGKTTIYITLQIYHSSLKGFLINMMATRTHVATSITIYHNKKWISRGNLSWWDFFVQKGNQFIIKVVFF